MKLSQKALDEFKALCKKHFGETLGDEEAYRRASNLLRLCMAVWNHLRAEDDDDENQNSVPSCKER